MTKKKRALKLGEAMQPFNFSILTAQDSAIFIEAINNPPEPNDKLKALFSKSTDELYDELLKKQGD